MGRFEIPDHPEIACIERTGYPSWMQEEDDGAYDDCFYEEQRERDLFGDY
jgi:hypothetical protein